MPEQSPLTAGFHHIGLAVRDLDQSSRDFCECLGWRIAGEKLDYPAIFVTDGHSLVTIWQVEAPDHCVTFNRRQNVGLHHVALKPPTAPRLTNLNADDFHLQGMAKLHRGTRDSVDEALTQFGQAIQRSGFRHGARNGSVVPFLAQGERVDE